MLWMSLCMFLTAGLFGVRMTHHNDEASSASLMKWYTGDIASLFGRYAFVLNLICVMGFAFSGLLGLVNWWIVGHKRFNWYEKWSLLIASSKSRGMYTIAATLYTIKLASLVTMMAMTGSLIAFIWVSLLHDIPPLSIMSLPLYCVTFMWLTFYSSVYPVVGTLISITLGGVLSQIVYFTLKMNRITNRLKQSTDRKRKLIVFCLRQWDCVRLEFAGQRNQMSLLAGCMVYLPLSCLLICIYYVSYLARHNVAAYVCGITVTAVGVGSVTCTLLAANQLITRQRKFLEVITKLIYIQTTSSKTLNKIFILESGSDPPYWSLSCAGTFAVSGESILTLVMESTCYYLLLVAAIGIPTAQEINEIFIHTN